MQKYVFGIKYLKRKDQSVSVSSIGLSFYPFLLLMFCLKGKNGDFYFHPESAATLGDFNFDGMKAL